MKAFAILSVLAVSAMARADVIDTRAELDALLSGSEEYLEDFEELSVHGGTSVSVPNPFNYMTGGSSWSSMIPGVSYSSTGYMVMYGGFLWGDDSNILQGVSDVTITFDQPQVAVGFDLDGVANATYHQTITYYHYNTVVGSRVFDQAQGTTLFIGWQDTLGITSVKIQTSATGFAGRAEIDNVAWGLVADPVACAADLDPNGVVDVFDLFALLSNWGTNGAGAELAPATNVVDVFDLFVLLSAWGNCN